jgi:hypothetical protein
MKKLSLSIVTALVFFVATAMAQTTPATDPQGTSTPPSTASPSNQTSTPESQTTPTAQQPSTSTSAAGTQSATTAEPKGEKKLKGCIESENGKFVLEAKHGKEFTLTGQDVSAHVGHQVVVHGSFQNSMAASASGETPGTAASAGSTSTSSTDMKAKAGQEFSVTSVDMVSSTCKDKDKDKTGEKHEHDKSSTQPPQ